MDAKAVQATDEELIRAIELASQKQLELETEINQIQGTTKDTAEQFAAGYTAVSRIIRQTEDYERVTREIAELEAAISRFNQNKR